MRRNTGGKSQRYHARNVCKQEYDSLLCGADWAALDFDLNGFTDRIFNEFIEEKLGRVTSGIDIAAVVEDKINQMDVREFEQLVLSVMKKELQAVVNLGALIGFVIGLINLIVL